ERTVRALLQTANAVPQEHLEIVREEGRLHPHADLLEDAAPGGGVASTGEHRGHACGKARGGQPAAVEIRGHTDRGGNGPAGLLQPRQTSCLTSAQWHVRRVDDVDQPALRLGRGGNQHGPMLVATRGRLYGTLVSAPVVSAALSQRTSDEGPMGLPCSAR